MKKSIVIVLLCTATRHFPFQSTQPDAGCDCLIVNLLFFNEAMPYSISVDFRQVAGL